MAGELGAPVARRPDGTPWEGPFPLRKDGWSLEAYEYDPTRRRGTWTYSKGEDVVVLTRDLR